MAFAIIPFFGLRWVSGAGLSGKEQEEGRAGCTPCTVTLEHVRACNSDAHSVSTRKNVNHDMQAPASTRGCALTQTMVCVCLSVCGGR